MHNPCARAFNHSDGLAIMVKFNVVHDDDMAAPKLLAKKVLHILLKDFAIDRTFDGKCSTDPCQRKCADH